MVLCYKLPDCTLKLKKYRNNVTKLKWIPAQKSPSSAFSQGWWIFV